MSLTVPLLVSYPAESITVCVAVDNPRYSVDCFHRNYLKWVMQVFDAVDHK